MSLLPSHVQRAIFVVDANDAGGLLKKALGLDPRGRKSALTPRLFLIGCLLTLQENKQLVMAELYPTLTQAVDLDSQVRLGIRDTTGGKPRFSENAIERFSARLSERLEYGRGSAKDLDDSTRALRRDAVMDVVDAMLRATLPDR